MAETQKKSVEEYLTAICQELDLLWGSIIQIKYLESPDVHYILVGPDNIYRDSEVFVRYQRDLSKKFKELWPNETLIIQKFDTIPNTKIIYDNTCTTPEG